MIVDYASRAEIPLASEDRMYVPSSTNPFPISLAWRDESPFVYGFG
jgi:hypothetical protein